MIFTPTPVAGSFLIAPEPRGDHRGSFMRMFCEAEFSRNELETRYVQMNNSFSAAKGTLRGMHYQLGAASEVKVVRCTAGSIFDVVLDLRPGSESFGRHFGAELTAQNRTMLYIPRGCAHGFYTLSENAEVFYLVSAAYTPEAERGVRYDDSRFGIHWPGPPAEISAKDAAWPDFDPAWHLAGPESAVK